LIVIFHAWLWWLFTMVEWNGCFACLWWLITLNVYNNCIWWLFFVIAHTHKCFLLLNCILITYNHIFVLIYSIIYLYFPWYFNLSALGLFQIWFFIFLFWTCCLFLLCLFFCGCFGHSYYSLRLDMFQTLLLLLWMLWSFINTALDLLCLVCLALGWFLYEWLVIMWMIVSILVLSSFWCCQRGRESCKV